MYICKDGFAAKSNITVMERKTIFILVLVLLVAGDLCAQRMSRKQELAALKKAYTEAISRTESLNQELASQVAAIDSLLDISAQTDALKKENVELKAQVAVCAADLEKERQKNASLGGATPIALFFEVGKTSIGAKEVVNLTFFVENAQKNNPHRSFTVYGIENDLAPQRVEYICNLLHKKYGIAKDRIINGGMLGKDAYPGINLNRVVIIK